MYAYEKDARLKRVRREHQKRVVQRAQPETTLAWRFINRGQPRFNGPGSTPLDGTTLEYPIHDSG